ncbi:MAG: type III polyketide synthase [Luteolibacter sp.]
MYLHSLSTASARHAFTQNQTWELLQGHPSMAALKPRSRSLLGKVLTLGSSGIDERQFAEADLHAVFARGAQELNESFERSAPALGGEALVKAARQAGMQADQIDALFVCSCTGYLCPGPSSYIAEALGMRSDTYLADLVGLGCGAAIPTLRAAQGYAAANPEQTIAVVAVEISSAAFYLDDDPGVLISLCLFGDGAAAAILGQRAPKAAPAMRFGRFDTHHQPEQREKIRFVNCAGRLKNQLHRSVPGHAAQAVSILFERYGEQPDQILAHSGGRDVIEAIEAKIPRYSLTETREILRRHGNLSSPSVLFALEERLQQQPESQKLWLTAFGAGFAAHSCELALQ